MGLILFFGGVKAIKIQMFREETMGNLLSVIVPCYNEEKIIRKTAEAINSALSNQEFDFIPYSQWRNIVSGNGYDVE